LPKSRDVLNSAGIEFKFGAFEIKINKKSEGDIKLEDWLVEEKSDEKKVTPKWKPNPELNVIEEETKMKKIKMRKFKDRKYFQKFFKL